MASSGRPTVPTRKPNLGIAEAVDAAIERLDERAEDRLCAVAKAEDAEELRILTDAHVEAFYKIRDRKAAAKAKERRKRASDARRKKLAASRGRPERQRNGISAVEVEDRIWHLVDEEARLRGFWRRKGVETHEGWKQRMKKFNDRVSTLWCLHRKRIVYGVGGPRYVGGVMVSAVMQPPKFLPHSRPRRTDEPPCLRCDVLGMFCSRKRRIPRWDPEEQCQRCVRAGERCLVPKDKNQKRSMHQRRFRRGEPADDEKTDPCDQWVYARPPTAHRRKVCYFAGSPPSPVDAESATVETEEARARRREHVQALYDQRDGVRMDIMGSLLSRVQLNKMALPPWHQGEMKMGVEKRYRYDRPGAGGVIVRKTEAASKPESESDDGGAPPPGRWWNLLRDAELRMVGTAGPFAGGLKRYVMDAPEQRYGDILRHDE